MDENLSTTKRRIKGEGSIYQTSDDKWRGKLPPSIETNNKTKYFTGKSRSDISKQMREFKSNAKTGFAPQNDQYFDEYIKAWLYNVKMNVLKPASFDRVESTTLLHIIPHIGHYKISEITPDLIQQNVIERMQNIETPKGIITLSHSSIKKAHDILNECLNYALLRGHVYTNPVLLTTMPRKDKFIKREIRFFSENEIELFVQACRSSFTNGEYRYMYGFAFIVMLYTGIRAGEMLKLTWDDVNFERKVIYIRGNIITVKDRSQHKADDLENGIKLKYKAIEQTTAKSKSSTNREVPINKKAYEALMSLQKSYKERFGKIPKHVVGKDLNSYITLSTFTKSFDKVIDRSGIGKCGIHTLRHTFASLLFKKGVDVKVVSEILGHSSVTITYNTYIHIITAQKQVSVELIDDM